MSIVSFRSILKLFVTSTVLAFVTSLAVHWIKLRLDLPNQEPDSIECAHAQSIERRRSLETLEEFYPFYLCEHRGKTTKLFHFVATLNFAVFLINFVRKGFNGKLFISGIVQAYFLAWISHFFIEQNKPATFKYPVMSFISDFIQTKDLLIGKLTMW